MADAPPRPHAPAPDGVPAFALHGVRQRRGGRDVLHAVDLVLPDAAVVALVGPSGAGKSSLLRLLNRLDEPAGGTVDFRGRPLAAYPVRALRRRVGYVAQAPVLFPGTVADNLRAAAALGAPPAALADAEVAALLARAGLDAEYAGRDAARLSGGERQRVAVSRALATGAEALLLDEPTAALDPEVAERLLATVRALPALGVTVVMVTHRLAEARSASTHVVMMEAGRVVEAGETAALFAGAREARTRAYLASAG